MNDRDMEWALFWCSLLHPVLYHEIPKDEEAQFLSILTQTERRFPDGKLRRPSLSTLKRKLRIFRLHGFEGLARKPRSDRGKPRAWSREVIQRACELKRDLPSRSHVVINRFLKAEYDVTIPPSTLYRHLRLHGATRLKLDVTRKKVRRRWTRDHTHALWLGDFEEGPYVLFQGRVVPTHLCAFIDCHSRFVVEARYYFRQNLDILIDSFLRALDAHGAPLELYVDNAKVYHSRALRAACFSLGIRLIHRKPYDPSPGGLIEKFFDTVQSQFETEVRAGQILTLDDLNRALTAYLHVSYHREVNSETGRSPEALYSQGLKTPRPVDLEALLPYFMAREQRTVHRDFSDVRLKGVFFRVDRRFRGDRLEVRYDPFGPLEEVLLYSLNGEYLGKGIRHQRETGENASGSPKPKPAYSFLDLLIREHEEELRRKAEGIDYRKALAEKPWPFASFLKVLAGLLGRKGDMTAFSTQELTLLERVYNRAGPLSKQTVTEAIENATEKTLAAFIYEIQKLKKRKE